MGGRRTYEQIGFVRHDDGERVGIITRYEPEVHTLDNYLWNPDTPPEVRRQMFKSWPGAPSPSFITTTLSMAMPRQKILRTIHLVIFATLTPKPIPTYAMRPVIASSRACKISTICLIRLV